MQLIYNLAILTCIEDSFLSLSGFTDLRGCLQRPMITEKWKYLKELFFLTDDRKKVPLNSMVLRKTAYLVQDKSTT